MKTDARRSKKKKKTLKPKRDPNGDERPCKGIIIGTKYIFKFPKKPRKSITKRILKCIHKFTDGIKNFHTFPISDKKTKHNVKQAKRKIQYPESNKVNPLSAKPGWYTTKKSKFNHYYLMMADQTLCLNKKQDTLNLYAKIKKPRCRACEWRYNTNQMIKAGKKRIGKL